MEWYVIMLNLSRWLEVLWLVDSCYLIFVIEIYFGLTDLPQLIYGRFNFIQHWHIQYSTLSYSPMKKSFCSIRQVKCHNTHWSCAFSSNCDLETSEVDFLLNFMERFSLNYFLFQLATLEFNTLTLFGAPLKNSILSFTHFSASIWSHRPWFPGKVSSPDDKNPNGPNL